MNASENQKGRLARRLALVVTNAIKISGLVLALNEVFGQPSPRTVELLVAAFMMTGAQISEEVVLGMASRFFGFHREEGEKEDRRSE